MTTDQTASDNAVTGLAMTEAYRLEQQDNNQLLARLDEVTRERSHLSSLLDEFAAAVAPADVLGEHTENNNPWRNALDLITPMAEVDQLRQDNAALERALALNEDADDDIEEDADGDLDDVLRTANDAMVHQLGSVLDVEAGLAEILTRREGA